MFYKTLLVFQRTVLEDALLVGTVVCVKPTNRPKSQVCRVFSAVMGLFFSRREDDGDSAGARRNGKFAADEVCVCLYGKMR